MTADDIQLTVSKGWVTLQGDVEWNYQKTEAERVVRNLRGVKGVTNLLTVKPRVKPDELKENIENALIRNARTDARNVGVPVAFGRTSITGFRRRHCRSPLCGSAMTTCLPSWRTSRPMYLRATALH